MKELVIASNNEGKIKEVREILKGFKIIPIGKFDLDLEINEDGKTFEENAIIKARNTAIALNGKLCIADDSGLEIEYLNGFPGVFTKRWKSGTDRQRNLEILEKLKNVEKGKRRARFTVAICVSDGTRKICEKGYIDGYISDNIRGTNGFGFDEIFELEDGRTLAQLKEEEKNMISARKIALEKIKDKIYNL